jgi:hypothetical protein
LLASAACGVERWTVKTLQDRPKLLQEKTTTISHLVSLTSPHPCLISTLLTCTVKATPARRFAQIPQVELLIVDNRPRAEAEGAGG